MRTRVWARIEHVTEITPVVPGNIRIHVAFTISFSSQEIQSLELFQRTPSDWICRTRLRADLGFTDRSACSERLLRTVSDKSAIYGLP